MSKRHHIARRLGSTARDAEEVVDVPLDDLPSDREVTRDLVAHLKHRLGMVVSERRSEKRGVRVKFVRAGYPADLAGLVPGDILTHVDGVPTHNLNEFRAAVGRVRGRVQRVRWHKGQCLHHSRGLFVCLCASIYLHLPPLCVRSLAKRWYSQT